MLNTTLGNQKFSFIFSSTAASKACYVISSLSFALVNNGFATNVDTRSSELIFFSGPARFYLRLSKPIIISNRWYFFRGTGVSFLFIGNFDWQVLPQNRNLSDYFAQFYSCINRTIVSKAFNFLARSQHPGFDVTHKKARNCVTLHPIRVDGLWLNKIKLKKNCVHRNILMLGVIAFFTI